jgi:hypothetical protein
MANDSVSVHDGLYRVVPRARRTGDQTASPRTNAQAVSL